jgi:predicted HD phosphohydrolase
VANHVPAKRYLCFKYADYYEALSDASKQTLQFQGGPMSEVEATAFESLPYFSDIIAVRKIDETAKMEHLPMPALMQYRPLIVEVLSNAS